VGNRTVAGWPYAENMRSVGDITPTAPRPCAARHHSAAVFCPSAQRLCFPTPLRPTQKPPKPPIVAVLLQEAAWWKLAASNHRQLSLIVPVSAGWDSRPRQERAMPCEPAVFILEPAHID
jgi:hypothetical protein